MAPHRYLIATLATLLASLPALASNVSWSYDVSVDPANLISGRWHFEDHPDGLQQVVLWNSDYSVQFEGQSGSRTDSAQVAALRLGTFGVGFDSGLGEFDPSIHSVGVDFTLTDDASGQSSTLSFQGGLAGLIDQFGASLQVDFTPLSASVTLGDNTYDVELLPFTLSQASNDSVFQGDGVPFIQADVTVRAGGGVGAESPEEPIQIPDTPEEPETSNPLDTPEPATLTLAALGLAGLGWMARRRKASR